MAAPSFLGLMGFYRRRRGPRGCPTGRGGSHPRVALGPRQGAAPGLWVASQVALWSPGAFHRIKILRKFLAQSDEISYGGLSEIQKQETGTRHLVDTCQTYL